MDGKFFQAAFLVILAGVIVGAAGSFYYYKKQYLPEERTIARLERELVEAKKARKIYEEALKKGRGEANYGVRFNYFTERGIGGKEIQAAWLKELDPWLAANRLRFQGLDINPPVNENHMTKYAFGLRGIARFNNIVKTMRWIEEEKRGVLTEFRVSLPLEKEKKASGLGGTRGLLSFRISWYWLEGAPSRLHSMASPAEPVEDLSRDPFKCYSPVVKAAESKESNRIVWRTAPSNVLLQGIMKVKGGYRAIIKGRYVRKGDTVDGYRVLSVNAKGVVLARKNYRYRLSLKTFKLKKGK